jgi:hypothetical protein
MINIAFNGFRKATAFLIIFKGVIIGTSSTFLFFSWGGAVLLITLADSAFKTSEDF